MIGKIRPIRHIVDVQNYQDMSLAKSNDLARNLYTYLCADITVLGDLWSLFLVVDLDSCAILGHSLKRGAFICEDLMNCLKITVIPFLEGECSLFHTGNASIFRSGEFEKSCEVFGLHLSRRVLLKHESQMIERLTRTIKTRLRNHLCKYSFSQGGKEYIRKEKLAYLLKIYSKVGNLDVMVTEVINEYKNTRHGGSRIFGSSPDVLRVTQDLERRKVRAQAPVFENSEKSLAVLSRNENSKEALEKANNRAEAIEHVIPPTPVYIQNEVECESQANLILERFSEQNTTLIFQNQILREQHSELLARVRYFEKREQEREREEVEDFRRREKRKERKRMPLRARIKAKEFDFIVDSVDQHYREPLVIARVKLMLLLLYLTGIRLSNLLVFTKRDVNLLLNEGRCETSLRKGDASRKFLSIGKKGQALLGCFSSELEILNSHQKDEGQPMFCTTRDTTKSLSIRVLHRQINEVLKTASEKLGKHLRSHSFRATFVTDLLENGIPLEEVKEIIGHKNLETTVIYRRYFRNTFM